MRIAFRLLRRLGIHAWQIFTRPLSSEGSRAPTGLELRVIAPQDALSAFADRALEMDARKAAEGFARGEICVGAFDGPRLAGYAWFAQQPAPHSAGIWMGFDSRAIYVYRAFVNPRYRGRGIAPALYAFADPLFLKAGKTFAVLCIEATNSASLTAARRAGGQRVGHAVYWHRGSRFRFWRTRGVGPSGFRFYMPT